MDLNGRNQQFEELKLMRDRNQARKFYQNFNKQRKNYTPVGSACKDRNGDLIIKRKCDASRFSVNYLMVISKTSTNRFHLLYKSTMGCPHHQEQKWIELSKDSRTTRAQVAMASPQN